MNNSQIAIKDQTSILHQPECLKRVEKQNDALVEWKIARQSHSMPLPSSHSALIRGPEGLCTAKAGHEPFQLH